MRFNPRKKYTKITTLVRDYLQDPALAGDSKRLEKEVLKQFPGSQWKLSHYHWHITRARKLGLSVAVKSRKEKLMDPKNRVTK